MKSRCNRGICTVMSTVCLVLVAGCGGMAPYSADPSTSSTGSAGVKISVTPVAIGLRREGTYTFQSFVSGSSNAAVTWSIQEGSAGGAIASSGTYTAPTKNGLYHVVATSQSDPTQSAVATVNVVSAGFSPAGGLGTARLQHTATLLPNGQVLVAGGGYGPDLIDGYWVVDQAELFDPVTAVFSPAGQIQRDGHTATLLRSGDVLLTGGEVGWQNLFPMVSNSAEVRITSTGSSQQTGGMWTAREGHAATLLNDGRVLITGGVVPLSTSWQTVYKAEIYDPVSGTFTPTGNMNSGRAYHTATLLPNGKVLVAGGGGGGLTAELFDPTTGTFALTGSMSVERYSGTATLLPSGKVLLAGGSRTATTELYDPATGLFTRTGDMSTSRTYHTATLLTNGTVLIAGGITIPSASLATTEIYDPVAGTFAMGPQMGQTRFSHTATLLPDGRVVIIGGASLSNGIYVTALSNAEFYQ